MSSDPEKKPVVSGIRAMGESDRSPEFKKRRDSFIGDVATFLGHIERRQIEQIPLENGSQVKTGAAIQVTELGKTATGMISNATEYASPGIYFSRDERNRPTLQITELEVKGPDAISRKVWHIRGGDPLEAIMFGPDGGYDTPKGQFVELAKVKFAEDQHYTDVVARGDGSVRQTHLNERGYHASSIMRSPDELFEAEHILGELGEQLIGPEWRTPLSEV